MFNIVSFADQHDQPVGQLDMAHRHAADFEHADNMILRKLDLDRRNISLLNISQRTRY